MHTYFLISQFGSQNVILCFLWKIIIIKGTLQKNIVLYDKCDKKKNLVFIPMIAFAFEY